LYGGNGSDYVALRRSPCWEPAQARARPAADDQRDLAAAAGVPQSTIARIESGARQPSLPALARILAAVDLELRIDLAAYDDHDDILDATEAHYTGRQQAARQAAVDEFLAGFTDVRR